MSEPFLAFGEGPGNVVLDIDGVVLLGDGPISGAGEALDRMEAAGARLLFATNAATRTRAEVAERLTRHTGHSVAATQVITSATAAVSLLGDLAGPVFVVGERGLRESLAGDGVDLTDDADLAAAVVVALDRGFTYDTLRRASTAIRGGARFIATNGDLTFPTPEGQVPGAGSIVAAVAAASGVEPTFAGKPHSPMVDAVTRVLGPGPTWMIGDRPETDLAFARVAGWRSVLTLSGVTSDPAEVPPEWAPDLVVASIADLMRQ